MSVPTNAELFVLLDQLDSSIADDLETVWLRLMVYVEDHFRWI